ncbi:MAG: hypothetical protein DCC68_06330 [Planctomycetota bacterium]|nr:MAG: hypothetical protein DCC68_06330 [Planctomycetota bacterium]
MSWTQVSVTAARKARVRKDLRNPRHLSHEHLEQRLVMYGLTGYQWTNTTVSASFLPDGTSSEGYSSNLFTLLDAVAPRATWQREFARALQTWANVSNLNFHFVADNGAASGASGSAQGDSRFGDIRLGAHDIGGPLAYAYYPSSYSTLGGDITMASEKVFSVGSSRDIYSVLLHEVGHAIGLGHSDSGTVMYAYITGVYSGLTADDIAGVQSIYGARSQDSYDAIAANDTFAAATVLSVGSTGTKSTAADLTSMADVDYYKVTAPTGTDGSLRVTLDARGKSLLAPKLSVYDSSGNFVTSADAGGNYGSYVTVELAGLTAGQSYYLVADGATSDAFGMGAYQISVEFGTTGETQPPPDQPPPPTGPVADRYETNDTFAAATNLGKFNSTGQSGLNLHTSTDRDVFRFTVSRSGTFNVGAIFSHAAGNIDLEIYNAQQQLIAGANSTTDNESITLNLSANTTYFIRVLSPDGGTNAYDLSVSKVGGGGGGGGGKGGRASDGTAGHPTFETEAEELAYYQHDMRHHAGITDPADSLVAMPAAIFLRHAPPDAVGVAVTEPQAAKPAAPVADMSLAAWNQDSRHRQDERHWASLAADLNAIRSNHSSGGKSESGQTSVGSSCAIAHDEALDQLEDLAAAPL